MTGEEYREAIAKVGLSQVGSARFFGVAETTCRKWIAETHAIPESVAMLLQLMIYFELTPDEVSDVIEHKEQA